MGPLNVTTTSSLHFTGEEQTMKFYLVFGHDSNKENSPAFFLETEQLMKFN